MEHRFAKPERGPLLSSQMKTFLAYACALMAAGTAVYMRFYGLGWEFDAPIYVVLFPAILLAAIQGGFQTGIFATLFSASLVVVFCWKLPGWSYPLGGEVLISMCSFLLSGAMVSAIAHKMRRNHAELLAHKADLQSQMARRSQMLEKTAVSLSEESLKRTEAQKALWKSDALYQGTFEHAVIGIAHADLNGRLTLINDSLCRITGYPREELLRLRLPDVCHPEDWLKMDEKIKQMLRGEIGGFSTEKRFLHRNGSNIWVKIAISLLRDADNQPLHFIATLDDISARVQAEEALVLSELQMAFFFEHAPAGIAVVDRNLRYMRVSKRFLHDFGLEKEAVLGRGLPEVSPTLFNPRQNVLRKCLAGTTHRCEEELFTKADGSLFWFQLEILPWHLSEGDVGGLIVVINDITAQKRAQQDVIQLNQDLETRVLERTCQLELAMTELCQEMAQRHRLEHEVLEISGREQRRLGQELHDELGQQLAGIRILSEILHKSLQKDQHPGAEDCAQIAQYVAEALSTTRNLSRSFYPLELERGGLELALRDLAERTGAQAKIACRLHFDPEFGIQEDWTIHLYRIVQESISNALRHGKPSAIEIECRAMGDQMTLRVSDDGSGFEESKLQKGLGLRLFQYRARIIGGKLSVQRAGPQGGCRVECVFAHQSDPGASI